jgi:Tfp pilus assembly protein PilO
MITMTIKRLSENGVLTLLLVVVLVLVLGYFGDFEDEDDDENEEKAVIAEFSDRLLAGTIQLERVSTVWRA